MEYWYYLIWNLLVYFIELVRFVCFKFYGDNGVFVEFVFVSFFIVFFFVVCLYYLIWKGILFR